MNDDSPRVLRFAHTELAVGVALVAVIAAIALLAPLVATHDPYVQALDQRLVPPSWYPGGTRAHLLGTDALGRDYFSRLVYGARLSLLIGVAASILSGLIGTSLGIVAGYFGGRVDAAVTFILSVRLALPVILVALAIAATIGNSPLLVVLVLGLLKWDRFVVVIRTLTKQIRARDFIAAARVSGATTPRILFREVLPNVMPSVIVVASLEAASAILFEAALSFLGLGVPPPLPSWGLMIAEGKQHILFSFWMIAFPGAALALLVLAINLLADGAARARARGHTMKSGSVV